MNLKTVLIGIVSAIIWSIILVNVINNIAGIGAGICFGIAFALVDSISLKKKTDGKSHKYQEAGAFT